MKFPARALLLASLLVFCGCTAQNISNGDSTADSSGVTVDPDGTEAATTEDEPFQALSTRQTWNVLLITVDCLRPDHMSVYGYHRNTTPNLAKFAEESLVFENAFASSASTSPGVISLLTGYYPPVHAQNAQNSYYDEALAAPLRILADEGYEVLGHSNSGPTYADVGIQKTLRENAKKGRAKLENFIEVRQWEEENATAEPFFAWAHLREPHLPYAPSEANTARWTDEDYASPGVDAIRSHWVVLREENEDYLYRHAAAVPFSDSDIPVVRALYDGEVADADERLGRAIDRMRETGLLDQTVVIVTADHGEELFEHGWVGHASTSHDGKLYDEVIRIPLIVRLPDRSLTGRVDALVQGIDVMPTVFDLLGISQDRVVPAMQGRSLLPLARGETNSVHEFVFAQSTVKGWTTPVEDMHVRVDSVRTTTHKLLRFPTEQGYRLEGYHLDEDPQELNDIYEIRPSEFADLEQAREDWSKENRQVAAALVQAGAERRASAVVEALQASDPLEAVRNWEALAVLERTWGMEVDPFFHHEPHRQDWLATRSAASLLMAEALACFAEQGEFRQVSPNDSPDPSDWRCDR